MHRVSGTPGSGPAPETPLIPPVLMAAMVSLVALMWNGWRLTRPSIWADEGATLSATGRSWSQLAALLGSIDAVHGLYYAFMKIWFMLWPAGAASLRVPSLLAVAVCAGVLATLAARWTRPSGALVIAGVFVVMPRVSWMAIEGRSWALTALLATACTAQLVAWREGGRPATRGRPGRLVAYGILAAVGIWLNIYLALLLIAHLVSLLALRTTRRELARWLVAAAAAVVAGSPVVVASLRQRAQLGHNPTLRVSEWVSGVAIRQFGVGDTPGTAQVMVPRALWSAAGAAIGLGLWACAVIGLAVWLRRRTTPLPAPLAWGLPWALLPGLIVGAVALTGPGLYNPRYFAFCTPGMALAAGWGITRLRVPALRVIAAVLLVGLAIPVWLSQRDTWSKAGYDWAQVAGRIQAGARAGDGVYFGQSPPTRTIAVSYPAAFRAVTDVGLLVSPIAQPSLAGESRPLGAELLSRTPGTLWVVVSMRDPLADEERFILERAGYREVSRWAGPQTSLTQWRR